MHATVFRRDKLQPFNPLVALYRAAVVDSGFILGSARHPRPEGRKVAQLEIEAHGLLARGGRKRRKMALRCRTELELRGLLGRLEEHVAFRL